MRLDVPSPDLDDRVLDAVARRLAGRRLVALTGAGMSTESGIPDYRGATTGRAPKRPIVHNEFVAHDAVRRRYWARSVIGYPRFAEAAPNDAHHALARLEHAGVLSATLTQNVDSLHDRAHSRHVVELHGSLARVRCIDCAALSSRAALQERLRRANPEHEARVAPLLADGDADVPDAIVARFTVPPCESCGGRLMPDVVFFGGNVPVEVRDAALAHVDTAGALLVLGTSLAVYSGLRFVRRARELGLPIVRIGLGPTRGDELADERVDARLGDALPRLAARLA